MKLSFLDIDEICKYFIPVKNFKFLEYRKFPPDSLFSLQIFGPLFSYKCGCKKGSFKGPNYSKKVCSKCDVEIIGSIFREKRYSYIELPYKVFNPLFYNLLSRKVNLFKEIKDILFERKSFELSSEDRNINECIMRLIKETIHKHYDSLSNEYKRIVSLEDKMFLDKILVIPPSFRPALEIGNIFVVDELNRIYSDILKTSMYINNMIITMNESIDIFLFNFRNLQRKVIELFDFVVSKLSGKKGIIRHNILGKRVDFSGRSVIVPDPTLSLDECGLPYSMVLEIVKPSFLKYLMDRKYSSRSNEILEKIEMSLCNDDYLFFDELSDFTSNMYCVLNRQPSLHRMSVLAFKIKIHKDYVIKINPLVCAPFNADFDGDAMAVYIPITEESQNDVRDNIFIGNNIISPTNLESICRPSQDVVLGIYTLTEKDEPRTVEYKGSKITEGRYLFNKCLPDDYPLVDKPVGKAELYKIFDEISFRFPPKVVMNVMDSIKNIGFEVSTKRGFTLSISDIYIPEIISLRDNLTGDIQKDLDYMKNNELLSKIDSVPVSIFVRSGARGSMEQLRQLVFCRGYVANSKNYVRENLIVNSFSSGLDPDEFFESCFGTRKGLLDTALSTGDSGYLTRQLIYSSCFLELSDNIEDCGSEDYLKVNVRDESFASLLIGRYYYDEKENRLKCISFDNFNELVGKVIKLRSPIYCKSYKICNVCYGNYYYIMHSNQIGIIATQAIGERATQLVLRTFHISGAVQDFSKDREVSKNQDIITGMKIAKAIFHNPYSLFVASKIKEGGDKEKLMKSLNKRMEGGDPSILVEMLYNIFSKFGKVNLVHFEVIVSSIMWSGDRLWRLIPNRSQVPYQYVSIMKVPSKVSWLLGMAFSHLNKGIINGILGKGYIEGTSLTELFTY